MDAEKVAKGAAYGLCIILVSIVLVPSVVLPLVIIGLPTYLLGKCCGFDLVELIEGQHSRSVKEEKPPDPPSPPPPPPPKR